jgi:alkanesulfonate monooxygenase SsuD/methylene tetrahydromethanopterin reductase-like flavin-dependent oxidoreductase (luciferase family)
VPRLLLILTENTTMRPSPDVGDLVDFAVAAEAAGIDGVMVSEHIVLGPSANALGPPKNPRDYALPGKSRGRFRPRRTSCQRGLPRLDHF